MSHFPRKWDITNPVCGIPFGNQKKRREVMVTNEDIVMSYPDQLIQVSESSCRIDSFSAVFDSLDAWLLKSPFNPLISNMAIGMIVQLVELNAVNPRNGLYLVKSLQADGFQLRLAGYDVPVGRGPGVSFGTATVQATVLDFSSFIHSAQATVDAHLKNSVSIMDDILTNRANDVVKLLSLMRMGSSSAFLKDSLGLTDGSLLDLEQRLLTDLKAQILMAITRQSINSGRWTRLIR
jgi:hypothetical protein